MKFGWQALRGCRLLLLVQLVAVASGCYELVGNGVPAGNAAAEIRLQRTTEQKRCTPIGRSFQQESRLCMKVASCQNEAQLEVLCVPIGTNE
jgi:hypothetical protein